MSLRVRAPRPPDTRAALFAATAAALIIAQQVAGRAARNAFFLSEFEVRSLPQVVIASALVSILAALGVSRLLQRHGPARVVPAAMVASAGLFLAEWALSVRHAPLAALAVYLHMAISGSVLISSFWSLVNERFDPHMGKHLIGRIATGATVGGVLGGLCAERVGAEASIVVLLPVMAVMNLLSLPALIGFARGDSMRTARLSPGPEPSGLAVLRSSPYFKRLALLIGLGAVTGAIINYALQAEAEAALPDGDELLRFFALYFTGTALLSFLCQATLSERALGRLGLGGTVALLPAATALGASFGAVAPSLASVVLLCGAEAVVTNSLFQSGYELLYNPLPAEHKRATKSLIDVGFDQAGRAAGSLLVLALLAVSGPSLLDPGPPTRLLLVAAATVALIGFSVAARLQRGYVTALADSLRSRVIESDTLPIIDRATERTVAETSVALRREEVLGAIAAARGEDGPALPTQVGEFLADLGSGEPVRVRRALAAADPRDARVVAHATAQLEGEDNVEDALRFLRRAAALHTGQLVDALVDPQRPLAVRRRVPTVLRSCRTQRAVDGLVLGLRDRRFEVRFQSARALLSLIGDRPELRVVHDDILAAVKREVEEGRRLWETEQASESEDDGDALIAQTVRRRTNRSLDHVFTLLSLIVDREPLRIAYQALGAEEEALRGTAIEYLENVLPAEIWEAMCPYLGGVAPRGVPRRRPREQVLQELLRYSESMTLSLETLRRQGLAPLGGEDEEEA